MVSIESLILYFIGRDLPELYSVEWSDIWMLIYISDLLSLDGDMTSKGLESDSQVQSSSCSYYFREAEVSFQTSLKYRMNLAYLIDKFYPYTTLK